MFANRMSSILVFTAWIWFTFITYHGLAFLSLAVFLFFSVDFALAAFAFLVTHIFSFQKYSYNIKEL